MAHNSWWRQLHWRMFVHSTLLLWFQMIKPKPGNGHATRVVNANSRTTPEPCLKLHWVYFWECLWVIARNSITPGLHYSICTPGKRYQKGHVSLDWVGSDKKSATANSQLSTHTGRYAVHGSDLEITPRKILALRQLQVTRQVFTRFRRMDWRHWALYWHHVILHAKKSGVSSYSYASLNAITACWWN